MKKGQAYFCRIENMQLRNPRMVGFGISNNKPTKQLLHMPPDVL